MGEPKCPETGDCWVKPDSSQVDSSRAATAVWYSAGAIPKNGDDYPAPGERLRSSGSMGPRG